MKKELNGSSKELQELEEEQSKLVNDLVEQISNLMKLKDDFEKSNKELLQKNSNMKELLSESGTRYAELYDKYSELGTENIKNNTFLDRLKNISLYDRIFNYKKIWKTYKRK